MMQGKRGRLLGRRSSVRPKDAAGGVVMNATTAQRSAGFLWSALIALLVFGVPGCDWLWPAVPEDDAVAASGLPRDLAPAASPEAVDDLVEGNTLFAFDLFRAAAPDEGNAACSPYSVSVALAMTYAGARGETERQMRETLHFGLSQQILHPAFNWLDLDLKRRGEVPPPYEGDGFELRIVQAVWGERGFPFLSEYLDVLAVNYGAGLRLADFSSDPEGARAAINAWIYDETNRRIENLLAEGTIDSDTRLVLTNALYFAAPWAKPFDEATTRDEAFVTSAGETVSVAMMHQVGTFSYARVGSVRAIELLYNGGQLAMLVLVPDVGQFEAFQEAFGASAFRQIVAALATREVELGLPKFQFSSDFSLAEVLPSLGMRDAFDAGAADFSGIDGAKDLVISDVVHKAFISVDEAGTEAAAATAVVIDLTATPEPPVVLTVDRPFLFVIRDLPTGSILFVGRVVRP